MKSSLGFRQRSSEHGLDEPRRIRKELRQFRDTCTTVDDFNSDLSAAAVEKTIQGRLKDETGENDPGPEA